MFICNFCQAGSAQFQTMGMLQEHIKLVHIPSRRTGLAPSKIKEIEQAKAPSEPVMQPVAEDQVPPPPPPKPVRKPIVLDYQYSGECETCGVPVETIKLEVSAGLFMVARCGNCRKQLKELRVIPIEKMEKERIEDEAEQEAIEENKPWPINKFKRKK